MDPRAHCMLNFTIVRLSSEGKVEGRLRSLCDQQASAVGMHSAPVSCVDRACLARDDCQEPIVEIMTRFTSQKTKMIGSRCGFYGSTQLLPPHFLSIALAPDLSPQPLSLDSCRMFPVSCPPTGWEESALRRAADGRIGAMQEVCRPAIQEARHGPPRRARSRRRATPLLLSPSSVHSCSLHARLALRLQCCTTGWGK
ncbi:hypothetical protein N657DRAFT_134859 [Parathielavia appendiculata]|uniref:Uncharacterized protein n=1 Tax=Parathielavia appendiculata TaxID=2587402 RepID=A0AAN6Z1Z2_9PEZI|nr:hypothetical protein N657DRAFT_134859 [Parathielavia appendiculata]